MSSVLERRDAALRAAQSDPRWREMLAESLFRERAQMYMLAGAMLGIIHARKVDADE